MASNRTSRVVIDKTKPVTVPDSVSPVQPSKFVPDSEEKRLGFERLVFFSDAVFAIAITLLAIRIQVGEIEESMIDAELARRILELWPQVLGYLVGFIVIGSYWAAHHRLFDYIQRYDRPLIGWNLFFLALIAIAPFPAGVIGHFGFYRSAQIFYALSVSLTGFAKLILWWYASYNHRLIDPSLDQHTIRMVTLRSLIVPVAFLISVPLTSFGPIMPLIIWGVTPFAAGIILQQSRRDELDE